MQCSSCHAISFDPTTICPSCGTPMPAAGFILATSRAEQLIRSGRYEEAGPELIKAEAELKLIRLERQAQCIAEARLLVDRARVLFFKSQYGHAEAAARQALALIDDSAALATLRANAFNILGNIANHRENVEQSVRYTERAVVEAEQAGEPFMLGTVLNSKANIVRHRGDNELAMRLYQQALTYAEDAGSLGLASAICGNMANLYEERGEMRTGLEYGLKSLKLAEQGQDELRITFALTTLGIISLALGDLQAAASHLWRADQMAETSKNQSILSLIRVNLAEIALLNGDYDSAAEIATQLTSGVIEDYRSQVIAYAIQVHCAVALGKIDKAKQAFENIIEERRLRNIPSFHDYYYLTLTATAKLRLAEHRWSEAQTEFEEARHRADEHGDVNTQGQVRVMYAEALLTNLTDAAAPARTLFEEARQRFARSGAAHYVQKVDALISSLPVA